VAAVTPARVSEPLGIRDTAGDERIDPGLDVVVLGRSEAADVPASPRLAIARPASQVAIQAVERMVFMVIFLGSYPGRWPSDSGRWEKTRA
jgi:hypothetical protein